MPERSDIEIDRIAWGEFLVRAELAEPVIRGEYGDDFDRVVKRMAEILQELKERHL